MMGKQEAAERKGNFNEYEYGYTGEQAMGEAARCLQCTCEAIGHCDLREAAIEYETTLNMAIDERSIQDNPYVGVNHGYGRATRRTFILRDYSRCIDCGRCAQVCKDIVGAGCYDFIGKGFDSLVTTADFVQPQRDAVRLLRPLRGDLPGRRADAAAAHAGDLPARRIALHLLRHLRRCLPVRRPALRPGVRVQRVPARPAHARHPRDVRSRASHPLIQLTTVDVDGAPDVSGSHPADPQDVEVVFLDAGGVLLYPDWKRVSVILAKHGIEATSVQLAEAEFIAKRRMDEAGVTHTTGDIAEPDGYLGWVVKAAGLPFAHHALHEAAGDFNAEHERNNLWSDMPLGGARCAQAPARRRLPARGVSNAEPNLRGRISRRESRQTSRPSSSQPRSAQRNRIRDLPGSAGTHGRLRGAGAPRGRLLLDRRGRCSRRRDHPDPVGRPGALRGPRCAPRREPGPVRGAPRA